MQPNNSTATPATTPPVTTPPATSPKPTSSAEKNDKLDLHKNTGTVQTSSVTPEASLLDEEVAIATQTAEKSTVDNQSESDEAGTLRKSNQYAQALATMATIDYKLQEKSQPEIKHFISKKMLISIVISLIVSLIGLILAKTVFNKPNSLSPNQDQDTVNQLLDTKQELNDLKSSY